MRIITRSVYGAYLQTSLLMKLPFVMIPNTTLNEKFNIQSGIAPQAGELPSLKYFCIGNAGHRHVTGADGIPYTTPVNHRASDAALFNHLPFVLREINNDLGPAQRQNYALRKEESINGKLYYAYYLKRLNLANVENVMQRTTVVNGLSSTLPFTPSSSNLNPTQPELPSTGVMPTTGDYLSTTAVVDVLFDSNDVTELINVARILYDNDLMAVISEIGLCTGVDRVVSANGPGGTTFNFNEAVAVQIASFITSFYSMSFTNNGFDFQIELGATEPLIGDSYGG